MKLLKKSLIFALVMSTTIFTGCGKDGGTSTESVSSNQQSSSSSKTDEQANSEVEQEVYTISAMGIDWGYGPLENSSMEQWWEEYFGVELDVEWVSYQDYGTKLNTLLATGDIPDVIQIMPMESSFYYPVFNQAINAGKIKELSPFLFDEGFVENNEIMSTWDDKIWENSSYKGGTYIIPRGTSEVAPNSGISVRRDLMREHGMEEEPTTVEELKDWLIELSQKTGLYGLDFSRPSFTDTRVMSIAVAFTGVQEWGIDKDGEFVYQAFAEGYIEFLDWMKDLYDAGAIDPEFILGQDVTSSWKSGNSIAFINQWYNWNQSADLVSNKIFDSSLPDTYEAWGMLPVEGPRGHSIVVEPYGFSQAIAINADCSDEKVREILRVFCHTGDDYIDVLRYGVEGLHYDMVDGERVSNEAQGVAKQEGYVGAWNQIFLTHNAQYIEDKFVARGSSDEAIERAEELKETTERLAKEMDAGVATLNLESQTYANRWNILISDLDDMCAMYVMGQIGPNEWNAYVESIVESDDYKAIQREFKEAKAQNN